jgi:hypothetical protein
MRRALALRGQNPGGSCDYSIIRMVNMRVVVPAKLRFCEQFDGARLWQVASSQMHNRPSRQLDARGGCGYE